LVSFGDCEEIILSRNCYSIYFKSPEERGRGICILLEMERRRRRRRRRKRVERK
jgi:hypothetical protein